MSAAEWIALASLAFVVLLQAAAVAFLFGGLFARMNGLETKSGTDSDCKAELAVLAAKFTNLENKVGEIGDDIKSVLTGRAPQVRRAGRDAA